ncbi:TetR/AcrR family transcriptional regulator [Cupriavidus basilensis]|nr:TetR/AcrR family transcriptional regulator [Cupriavidus basilensis]
MARPLSPEKRLALLLAATEIVAEQGVMATTAGIARRAGVAEGSLFTYFENKEGLFQELYRHLKRSLADVMMPDYPHQTSVQLRMQHVFQRYVGWGLENPTMRSAVARLSASGVVLEETQKQALEPFRDVYQMMEDAIRSKAVVSAPPEFVWAVMESIADATIDFVDKRPRDAEHRRNLGFITVWKAIST